MGRHLETLIDGLCQHLLTQPGLWDVQLTDSLLTILSKRSDSAQVATQWADKSFCATKRLYYHGLKLHLISTDRLTCMPS